MKSIRTICKKLNVLIKIVLIDKIHDRFNGTRICKVTNKKLINLVLISNVYQTLIYFFIMYLKVGSEAKHDTPITVLYNSSNSTFTFRLNDAIPFYFPVCINKSDI